jgi:hypothetical protein
VVDYGSRPFKAMYRPFRDSDVEVEVTWFPAAPGAKFLGFQSCITNPFWERDQFTYTDEYLPLDTVEPTGKPRTRPGTGRGGYCGTVEDFAIGGKYLPDEPPVTYGQAGLPTCCGAPVAVAGAGVGGRNSLVVTPLTPGTTCPTAAEFNFEVPTLLSVPAAGTYWHRVPTVAGFENVFIVSDQVINPLPPTVTGALSGSDCPFLFGCGAIANGPNWQQWLTAIGGDFFFLVQTTGPLVYTVLVTRTHP